MASFTERMMGAAKLDVHTYEEVEADTTAMGQAMGVVVLSAVAAGIGTAGRGGAMGVLGVSVGALIGWFIWAGLTYLIGTKVLPEPQTKSDMGELLRTIGFSASPGIARVLGIIPFLGPLIMFAASIWMLVAMVVAVRQALDYRSTGRAVGVCLIGFIAYLAVVIMVRVVFGIAQGIAGAVT